MTRNTYHSRVPSPRLSARPRGAFFGAAAVSVFRASIALGDGSGTREGRSP